MATMDARSDSLAAGEAALERGAWAEARAAFERALGTGAGPEMRWEYPDRAALRAHLSSGPAAKAMEGVGEERVAAAISGAIAPIRTAAGRYVLENSWRYLVARR